MGVTREMESGGGRVKQIQRKDEVRSKREKNKTE